MRSHNLIIYAMIYRYLISAALLFILNQGIASHILGGGLAWNYLGNNQYEFVLVATKRCNQIVNLPFDSLHILNVDWAKGTIPLSRDTAFSQKFSLPFIQGDCVSEAAMYRSNPVTIDSVPQSGYEFSVSNTCCLYFFENLHYPSFPKNQNTYYTATMYGDSSRTPPQFSTFEAMTQGKQMIHGKASYNNFNNQVFLKPDVPRGVDSMGFDLAPLPIGAGAVFPFKQGYNYSNPLPDTTENPNNGVNDYNSQTGIFSYQIKSDSGFYAYHQKVDLYIENALGKQRKAATIYNEISHFIANSPVLNNPPSLATPISSDTVEAYVGSSLSINFTGRDSLHKVKLGAVSTGFESSTFTSRGAQNFNVIKIVSGNNNGLLINDTVSKAGVTWTPTQDNYDYGPTLIDLFLKAQDSLGIGSKTTWKRVVIRQNPTVKILNTASDTIFTAPHCSRELSVKSATGKVYWKPDSLVKSPQKSNTKFIGNRSAWLYVRDSINPSYRDSIFIAVLDSSNIRISRVGSDLVLSSPYPKALELPTYWTLQGFPFAYKNDTLPLRSNGLYQAHLITDSNCVALSDTFNSGTLQFHVLNNSQNIGKVDTSVLDSLYSFDFQLTANFGKKAYNLNSIQVYGITKVLPGGNFGKNLSMRLYDASGNMIWQKDKTINQVDNGFVYLSCGAQLQSEKNYRLVIFTGSRIVMSTLSQVNYPYVSPAGIKFFNPAKAYALNNIAQDSTNRLFMTSFSFGDPLEITEMQTLQERWFYPNPTDDFLKISLHRTGVGTLKIYDIRGKLLKKQRVSATLSRISVADLQTGFYILELNGHRAKLQVK